jgi:hypothetical protein
MLAAMAPKSKPFTELGGVDAVDDFFRADVRYRTVSGQVHIYGPRRQYRHRAEADLDQIRAAGAVGNTREHGLEIMAAEARRIQLSAQFAAEARAEMQRRRETEEQEAALSCVSDEEPEDDPWLQDYPSPRAEEVTATPLSQKTPLTREEADHELKHFRPIRSYPHHLEHILACRADPNKPCVRGDISPLRKVLTFAQENHVERMRELLLEHGANETEEDRKQWATCQKAWLYERIRIRESRIDPQDYDPCGAAVERNM